MIDNHAEFLGRWLGDGVYRWTVHPRKQIRAKRGRQSARFLLRLDLGKEKISLLVSLRRTI
jgi:hypothetical protein